MNAFQIGPFLIEPSKGCISDGENQVSIEPKAMAVLIELNANHGKVVSQQTLFSRVWPDRIFSPSSLQRAIAIIRKALNESSQNPKYIFTHPKLGYRLELPDKSVIKDDTSTLNKPVFKSPFSLNLMLLISSLVLVLLIHQYVIKAPVSISSPKVMTFGQHAEYNGKLAPNKPLFAFQSESDEDSLFVSNINNPSNLQKISFKNVVVDFVWRNHELFTLTQTSKNQFDLVQVNLTKPESKKHFHQLSQWRSVRELVISDDSTLWFIGQAKNDGRSHLVRHDLVLNTSRSLFEFEDHLTHVSLAPSPVGVYFHYYQNNQAYFGLIDNQHNIINYHVNTPEISDIHWHHQSQSLLISNLMTPQIYTFKNGMVSLLTVPLAQVLSDVSSVQNTLIATQTRTDMDIVHWQNGIQQKYVDSKFSDYQATINSASELAFISSRNGKPQFFIKNESLTKIVYDNPENIQFYPPLMWSPDNMTLAFIEKNKLHLLDTKTGHINIPDVSTHIDRIISWSADNKIIIKHNDSFFSEYDIATQSITPLALKNASFVAKDSENVLLGIDDQGLFWGELRTPFKNTVIFAMFKDDHIIIQSRHQGDQQLHIFNHKLASVTSAELATDCLHLTDVVLDDLSHISWFCTKLEPDDSEIIKFDHFQL